MASGTINQAAGTGLQFIGESAKQKRRQFVVTNLDAGKIIKLRTLNGAPFATVYPQTSFTLETANDIEVFNPDGAATVSFEVCELFYDAGSANIGSPAQAAAAIAAAGGSPAAGGGGGSYGGNPGGGGNTQPK